MAEANSYDIIIVGAGQSGLALSYYLRRLGWSYLILDANDRPGGSWAHTWDSLRLFSPAQFSSLPGILMPGGPDHYPHRDEVISYLQSYEERYQIPVQRPVKVLSITKEGEHFLLQTSRSSFRTKVVVSASGTFSAPKIPAISGLDQFQGLVFHSSQYKNTKGFEGKEVLIVGEGNSGAQIMAELSDVASCTWLCSSPPQFLPDHVDGRFLFDAATQQHQARIRGEKLQVPSLGHIVMVPSVKKAQEAGKLSFTCKKPAHFTPEGLVWEDGSQSHFDIVLFCTGFSAAIDYLSPLGVLTAEGKVQTEGCKAQEIQGLWLLGYGNWTGFASATLIGVGRSAKKSAEEINTFLNQLKNNLHE